MEDSPLVVTMADGGKVDLRSDAPVARPFESWFGDIVKRKELEGRIAVARSSAQAEQNQECIVVDVEKFEKRLQRAAQ